MVLLKEKKVQGMLEESIFKSDSWHRGYSAFNALLKKPLGWMYLSREVDDHLIRIDRKSHCSWYCQSASHEKTCEDYLLEFARAKKQEGLNTPQSFHCHAGKICAAFPVKLLNENHGYFITCNLREPISSARELATSFHEFLKVETDLAHKSYEIKNFYETVHPRALALSTMHAVHRVISSAFSLDELLPRIARLSMQILKARHCSISLVDADRKYLLPKFSTESSERKQPIRKKIGRGLEGRVVHAGEIYFSRRVLAVPFIDQDVIGILMIKDKIDGKPFTLTELEILKILSEQTVVAIKNAQLYAETQQLTLGSIKSITELLELDFAGDNIHLPLFAKLVRQIGIDMGLSRRELTDLDRAVLLLDTGYIGLPEKILSKKSQLTQEEYETIKEHPHRGANVLKSIGSLKPVIPIILHHHERYDGKGYPQGLRGDEIPIGARIVAVVDSFTAMISSRPYRKTKKIEEAIEEIKRNSGTQFDPKVVHSFLKEMKHMETSAT